MRAARIGAPIFIIILGALARWAVSDIIPNVDLKMVGMIAMIAGAIWLVLELVLARPRSTVTTERTARSSDAPGAAGPQQDVVEREVRHDGI